VTGATQLLLPPLLLVAVAAAVAPIPVIQL
jgi:hypothetical protein